MDLLTILLTAFGLSLDCFAVALAAGIPGGRKGLRAAARVALAFGAFQAGMPVLGWLAGESVTGYISGFDHWIAFFLLALVGVRMIREGVSPEQEVVSLETGALLILAVATSIDALAVGISLAFLGTGILIPCLLIGLLTFVVSFTGAILGGAASERWGKTMEILGGMVLMGIGIRILVAHMAG
jgi:putative Mn2+ efflux pump MntP